jgi:transposase-like protein
VATSLGVSTNELRKWRQQMSEIRLQMRSQQHGIAPAASENNRELARENRELRREVELRKQERDIKKAMAYFAQPPK